MTEVTTINEYDYFDTEFLAEVQKDTFVASTMFDSIFIPSKRLPLAMVESIRESENLDELLLANSPLQQTRIEKPYWVKGSNIREFDSVICEVYGSICLADDRHLLDNIIAHGAMMNNASNYTLRQFAELADIEIEWDAVSDQQDIDRPLKNHGIYFHVTFSDLCKALGLKNTKPNRANIQQRLHRLSIMQLILNFEKNGRRIENRTRKISLVDKDFFSLLVPSRVRNKNSITSETVTDLLINVSSYYVKTLEDDGQISRDRFLNEYQFLNGPHSLVDFFKYIDKHKRDFVHGKHLSKLIKDYYNNKMTMFGMNVPYKISTLTKLVLKKQDELREFYNLILKKETDIRFLKGNKEDWIFYYRPLLNGK
jgi:hypothetical protein